MWVQKNLPFNTSELKLLHFSLHFWVQKWNDFDHNNKLQKLPCAIRTAGILILILDDIFISPLSLLFIRYTTTPCFTQLPLAVSLWNSFLLFSFFYFFLSLFFKSQPSTPKIYYFFLFDYSNYSYSNWAKISLAKRILYLFFHSPRSCSTTTL